MHGAEIIRKSLTSDVFGHSNAHDRIVNFAPLRRDFSIIAQSNCHVVCQSSFRDSRARPAHLRLAQSNSFCAHAEMSRGVDEQSAPAATDVEQTLPRTQAQFAAEIIEFVLLGCIKAIVWRLKVCAGIHHAPIKPQAIKIIRNIVMKCHRTPIALWQMPLPADLRKQLVCGPPNCRSSVARRQRNQ